MGRASQTRASRKRCWPAPTTRSPHATAATAASSMLSGSGSCRLPVNRALPRFSGGDNRDAPSESRPGLAAPWRNVGVMYAAGRPARRRCDQAALPASRVNQGRKDNIGNVLLVNLVGNGFVILPRGTTRRNSPRQSNCHRLHGRRRGCGRAVIGAPLSLFPGAPSGGPPFYFTPIYELPQTTYC